jgi:anti-anti-sigma regulatory factor
MTLRIVEEANAQGDVVALHGWLSAAEVEELGKVVAAKGPCLRIDLEQLAGVDAAGLQTLRRLQEKGARLTGASPYIELLLQRKPEADDDER